MPVDSVLTIPRSGVAFKLRTPRRPRRPPWRPILQEYYISLKTGLSYALLTISFGPRQRFGIHSDYVLRPTWSDKRPSFGVLVHQVVKPRLQSIGTGQLPFRAPGLSHERAPIGYANLHKPIRQICVQRIPLFASVRLVSEDDLDEQDIGEGIADCLVDHVDYSEEVLETGLLGWRARKRFIHFANVLEGLIGKEDRAVSVGFKVNANGILLRGMVQVLYTSWGEIFIIPTLEGRKKYHFSETIEERWRKILLV